MRKSPLRLLLVVCVVVGFAWLRHHSDTSDEIEYAGQKFKESKAYPSYEDYKDDPDKLARGQEALIEKTMLGVKLPPTFLDRHAFITGTSELQFPGYGMSSFGAHAQPDGTSLDGGSVEIPMSTKGRVFVYRVRGGRYELLDDFVYESSMDIMNVKWKGDQLEYSDLGGHTVLTRTPSPTK